MKKFINDKLNYLKNKINEIKLNLNKLNDDDKKLFNNFKYKYKMLKFLYDEHYKKFDFFLFLFFSEEYKLHVRIMKNIENYQSLYVVDNLHDFKPNVASDEIRNIILSYLIKNFDNDKYAKQIYDIIYCDNKIKDVNEDKTMKKIFGIYKMKHLLNNNENILPFDIYDNSVYFETQGLFKSKDIYCSLNNIQILLFALQSKANNKILYIIKAKRLN